MTNRSLFKNLLPAAGLAGLFLATILPVSAQENATGKETKKVRMKIITDVNGQQTVRDTIVEISGDLPIPDLKELDRFRTRVNSPDSKEREMMLFRSRPSDATIRSIEEVEKLIYKVNPEGEVKYLRPEEINNRFKRLEKSENGEVKAYRFVVPDAKFEFDSSMQKKVFIFKDTDNELIPEDLERIRVRRNGLKESEIAEIRKLLPISSDSLAVFKRVIIIHCDFTDPEKQLLDKNAQKATSSSKLKDLELKEVDLYPNPNSGLFNLSFEASKKSNTTITILDALGREVYRENLKNFKGNYQKEINLSHLSKGVYFLQVVQGKQVFNKKVMLQ